MKKFSGARVQFTSYDSVTDETYRFSLSDLKEDADVEVIKTVGEALNDVIDGDLETTTLIQTFNIA